jgi:hypothetical protein
MTEIDCGCILAKKSGFIRSKKTCLNKKESGNLLFMRMIKN